MLLAHRRAAIYAHVPIFVRAMRYMKERSDEKRHVTGPMMREYASEGR